MVASDAQKRSRYSGAVAALATMHGKAEVIRPVMFETLGLEVTVCDVDTDAFGTFSGETPRVGTPYETALAKARAGMSAFGSKLGLASEGTIGRDPVFPLGTSDLETMVFIDDELGITVSESVRSLDIVAMSKVISVDEGIDEFLASADFPHHGLIVKSLDSSKVVKGIINRVALDEAIRSCAGDDGKVIVESDFRAHFSPSRMRVIAECARVLALRLAQTCPACEAPGWGKVKPLLGMPCGACGRDVALAIRADCNGCVRCDEVEVVERDVKSADPKWCEFCNP